MNSRIIVLICAATTMAACGGNGRSSSSCTNGEHSHAAGAAAVKKVISAQVFVNSEKVDAFLAAASDVIEKSRSEAGNISYSLYQDPQDKTKFLFFEEWKNQEAVDTHFATDHFQKFGKALNDCSSAPAVITIYDCPSEKKQ